MDGDRAQVPGNIAYRASGSADGHDASVSGGDGQAAPERGDAGAADIGDGSEAFTVVDRHAHHVALGQRSRRLVGL